MGRGRARAKARGRDGPDGAAAGVREPVTPRPPDLSGAAPEPCSQVVMSDTAAGIPAEPSPG